MFQPPPQNGSFESLLGRTLPNNHPPEKPRWGLVGLQRAEQGELNVKIISVLLFHKCFHCGTAVRRVCPFSGSTFRMIPNAFVKAVISITYIRMPPRKPKLYPVMLVGALVM